MKQKLQRAIQENTAVGGVVGLGYVGLPLLQQLDKAGYQTIGFDIDTSKVAALNEGRSYVNHIDSGWIRRAIDEKRFTATNDPAVLAKADCISICVPTPLDIHYEPDLSYIMASAKVIAEFLKPGQLIILESTTYPGTTVDVLLPIFEKTGWRVGKDYFLAFSPERVDPGNPVHSIETIPKVVGGVTEHCTELTTLYYKKIFPSIVPVSSPAAAELSKLLENIFRSVNIALVNELKVLCNKMGIDIWEVIDAAATKPFGFMPFYPGPGLGGHCIPIDPFYLSWKAREYGFSTRFIELAGQINTAMPHYVVTQISDALNKHSKCLNGARILVLGAAYKKNIDDLRESPALELMELLHQRGARVDYNDPYVPRLPKTRRHDLQLESVTLTAEALTEYDCVLIATAHSAYDYDFILEHASLVVDTRNATKRVVRNREKIVMA